MEILSAPLSMRFLFRRLLAATIIYPADKILEKSGHAKEEKDERKVQRGGNVRMNSVLRLGVTSSW